MSEEKKELNQDELTTASGGLSSSAANSGNQSTANHQAMGETLKGGGAGEREESDKLGDQQQGEVKL
jgi:hypothetical protein